MYKIISSILLFIYTINHKFYINYAFYFIFCLWFKIIGRLQHLQHFLFLKQMPPYSYPHQRKCPVSQEFFALEKFRLFYFPTSLFLQPNTIYQVLLSKSKYQKLFLSITLSIILSIMTLVVMCGMIVVGLVRENDRQSANICV